LSGDTLRQHLALIKQAPDLTAKLHQVFSAREFAAVSDVDGKLYDGFFSAQDKSAMNDLHRLSDWDLADWPAPFADARGEEMLFRYRARNYPDTLNEDERERWEQHRQARLLKGIADTPVLNYERFAHELQLAAQQVADDPVKLQWIQDLQLYAEAMYPYSDY